MPKRTRIIGIDTRTRGPVSGIFDLTDIKERKQLDTHQIEEENVEFQNKNFWPEKSIKDPYYGRVITHITATDTVHYNLLTDESSNRLIPYTVRYDENLHVRLGGPKSLFSIFFREGSYTVNDHSSLRLSGAFTIRFWIKLHRNHATEHYLMGKGGQAGRTSGTGWVIYISSSYRIGFYDAVTNTSIESPETLARDTWYYVCFIREGLSGLQFKIYINGILFQIGTSAGVFSDTNPLYINRDRANTQTTCAACLFFDVQIWNSVQADFATTVPIQMLPSGGVFTIPPDQCWNPYNTNWQQQGLTVTGSGSEITRIPMHPFVSDTVIPWSGLGKASVGMTTSLFYNDKFGACNLGQTAFTVELWLCHNSHGYETGIISKGTGSRAVAGSTGWALRCDGSGNLEWFDNASVITGSDVNTRVPKGSWVHVACVRTNTGTNGFSIYVNGRRHVQGTVASDYSSVSAVELKIGATRSRDYISYLNGYHAVKISNIARYTDNFTVNTSTFYDTMTTVDSNTRFLVFTNRNCLYPHHGHMHNYTQLGYEDVCVSYKGSEYRTGYKSIQSRADTPNQSIGGHSVSFTVSSTNKVLVYDANNVGAFNFTGNFSIEFFYYTRRASQDGDTYQVFIDSRTVMNDTGIAINQTRQQGLEVWTNGGPILSSNQQSSFHGKWQYVCVQRIDNKIALYANGEKVDEAYYTSAITSPARKLTIGNGSWDKIRYGNGWYGYMSNLRVTKTAPYAVNGVNPQFITVPSSSLPIDSNTMLYTLCGPILKDYSSYDILTASGGVPGFQENNGGTVWDVYTSNFSPFSISGNYKSLEHGTYDNTGTHGLFQTPAWYGYTHSWANGSPSLGFIQRFSRAWTIEFWYYSHETHLTSPGSQGYIHTQSDNSTQQGFYFLNHYNGTVASKYDVCFIVICNSTRTNFATTGNSGNVRPHGWNHAVLCYDPSNNVKIAMFINGKRVFTTSTVPTPSTHWYTLYSPQTSDFAQGPVRISDIARYDNSSSTISPPTVFRYDKNCAYLNLTQKNYSDISNRTSLHCYAVFVDDTNKLFNKPTLFFPGFSNHDGTYLGGSHHSMVCVNSGWSWNEWTHDTRYSDWCIEFHAQWYDLASGGQNFISGDNSIGACLFHRRNWLWCGIGPTGLWNLRFMNSNSATTTWQKIISTVTCATKSNNRFDYVCVQNSGKNFVFYVNGIEQGKLIHNNQGGGYTGGLPDNYTGDESGVGGNYNIGCDWSGRLSTRWLGWIAEFRHTAASRYQTCVINNQARQVFKGTEIPVDFSQSWPQC